MTDKKETKIRYLLYHPTWEFKEPVNMLQLKQTSEVITVHEYRSNLKGHYFCISCGVPCYRRPENSDTQADGKPAHFVHCPGYNQVLCPSRTLHGEAKRYTNEKEKQKAIDNGTLTVIRAWSDTPEEKTEAQPEIYKGTVEDQTSKTTGGTINRHVGNEKSIPQSGESLRTIAFNLTNYIGQYIQLPDWNYVKLFDHIFTHITSLDKYPLEYLPDETLIYFGQVHSGREFETNTYINLKYTNHYKISLLVPTKIIRSRQWSPITKLLETYIMFVGQLRASGKEIYGRKELIFNISHLGAIAQIPKDNEDVLSYFLEEN